jgi:ribonuclease-3
VTPSAATVDEALFAPFVQDDRPHELARALNIPIHNPALLRLALTHRSVLHEWAAANPDVPTPHSNERLEFLGDAYLGMIVAEELFNFAPDAQEGELTSWRVALVRAERLVAWARDIALGSYLYLGAGERVTESARDRMLAGAFEALIGAIALDSGLDGARDFVLRFVHRDIDSVVARKEAANPKGRLQELLQDRFRTGPAYRIVQLEGPDHARVFTAEVSMFDHALGQGSGPSKREAEQDAARDALSRLGSKRELDRLATALNGIMEQTSEQRG